MFPLHESLRALFTTVPTIQILPEVMSEVRQRKNKGTQEQKGADGAGRGGVEKVDKEGKIVKPVTNKSMMKKLVGFEFSDFSSSDRFYRLCHAPTDPSCLALFRMLFGKKLAA